MLIQVCYGFEWLADARVAVGPTVCGADIQRRQEGTKLVLLCQAADPELQHWISTSLQMNTEGFNRSFLPNCDLSNYCVLAVAGKSLSLPCLHYWLNINLLSFKKKIGLRKPNTMIRVMICVMSLFKFLLCLIKLQLYLYTVVLVQNFHILNKKLNRRKFLYLVICKMFWRADDF